MIANPYGPRFLKSAKFKYVHDVLEFLVFLSMDGCRLFLRKINEN